jgi:hypothetical protein
MERNKEASMQCEECPHGVEIHGESKNDMQIITCIMDAFRQGFYGVAEKESQVLYNRIMKRHNKILGRE